MTTQTEPGTVPTADTNRYGDLVETARSKSAHSLPVDVSPSQRRKHLVGLCLAKTGSAFEINNIPRGRVTCCVHEIQLSRSFGEGHPFVHPHRHSGEMDSNLLDLFG